MRSGETLYSIARRYDLDYRDLARWKGIRGDYLIYPGDRLRLAAPSRDGAVPGAVSPAGKPRVALPADATVPAAAAPAACPAQATDGKDPRPHCCFTNARYVGTCEVEPSKDETCASILEYLNNPQSQGKAYCGSTNVRGGWKPVPCEPKMKQD